MSSKDTGKAPTRSVTIEDDEDIDDLDDVAERFTTTKPSKPSISTSGKPVHGPVPPPTAVDPINNDAFQKELAQGFEALFKDLGIENPSSSTTDQQQDQKLRDAFSRLLVDELEGNRDGMDLDFQDFLAGESGKANEQNGVASGSGASGKPKADGDFQNAIRQTMEKLKDSDDALKADAANSADPLAQLLQQLGKMGGEGAGEGEGEDGDMQSLLENMMSSLMSKDMLYEPLKELDEKASFIIFPEYFEKHGPSLSPSDKKKYEEQASLVKKTVNIFDDPSYSDDNPEKSAEILKMMNEMQSLGSPPAEIMGELPPGFSLGTDGMPNIDNPDQCVIS
ncbi:Peroxisome chaperone and import receptor [Tulasnella sp. 419]|nr:Peroxisome chaperone and import receptor [Tulasnella sp. 419]